MSYIFKLLFNPALWISVLNVLFILGFFGSYPTEYHIIAALLSLLIYIFFTWFSSTRPLSYHNTRQCMSDIFADICLYSFNLIACVLWFFMIRDYFPQMSHTQYLIGFLFLLVLDIIILIEMILTISNSLRGMYLINPVRVQR